MRISVRSVLTLLSMFLCAIVVLALAIAPNAVEEPVSPIYKDHIVEPIMAVQTAAHTVTNESPEEPIEEVMLWTEEEVTVLAKMLWGEARGVPSDTEKAACIWCVLNRVDQGMGTIIDVVTAPYQFVG